LELLGNGTNSGGVNRKKPFFDIQMEMRDTSEMKVHPKITEITG
jgi:hypothetical protein